MMGCHDTGQGQLFYSFDLDDRSGRPYPRRRHSTLRDLGPMIPETTAISLTIH